MPGFDIFDTLDTLRQNGDAFCVATVLRTADVTSAKAGAKAAVTTDGQIHGHLGGGCVQRAVKAAAETALAQGAPQMIRVKPSEKVVEMHDPDGFQTFKSGCPSGGTVDLLIEPYQPAPRLAVFGSGPIATALTDHATLTGLRVVAGEQGLDHIEPRDFVVVASQGQGDLAALRQALDSPARRVSMVASRRKADVLSAKLIGSGLTEASVHRLKSPAGLDIGAVDPQEIALSILAEIVKWRNQDMQTQNGDHDEKMA
ncbi:XdhC family protein [Phaeobacter marinintestinus]|uniref:XdhC family protein n=1 Tax=Falsiphaeobacter marinintestinus TaxID=1492905 RepID=UPI0011B5DB72|nr:XdhC family protein [Phaeobacter marinintestinus]